MINNDLVTVIVPVYNAEKYIEQTISSLENQTYTNYEAIVIDDCSTDNSVQMIEKHLNNNPRIRLIKLKKNKGVAFARNLGIRKAKGRYLTFLDADDIWLENKLEEQVKYAKSNDYAFSYSAFKYMNNEGTMISKKICVQKELSYNKALLNTRILPTTAMLDLTKIPKYYCYMPSVMHEDMATWWKILKKGYKAYGQNEVLAYYRLSANSRSSNKIKSAYYRWKLYRDVEKLGVIKSIYCFTNYVINAVIKRKYNFKNITRPTFKVALSTQNLKSDEEVDSLVQKMKINSDYIIINQTLDKDVFISNDKVITKYEKGLCKSRNAVIENANSDIVLFSDDDVIYNEEYKEIVLEAYEKYKDADIICFYVDSMNKKRRTKRIRNGKIGYINAMRIISAEISCKVSSLVKSDIRFDENFGIGSENNRGEEQILIYEALKKGLKVFFVNKKIADISQQESSWFTKWDEKYFKIQGRIFKRLTKRYWLFWVIQYAIRKYPLYKEDTTFWKALKNMLNGAKEYN